MGLVIGGKKSNVSINDLSLYHAGTVLLFFDDMLIPFNPEIPHQNTFDWLYPQLLYKNVERFS